MKNTLIFDFPKNYGISHNIFLLFKPTPLPNKMFSLPFFFLLFLSLSPSSPSPLTDYLSTQDLSIAKERHQTSCPSLSFIPSLPLSFVSSSPTPQEKEGEGVVALHSLHDSHVVYGVGGEIQWVLELERVFEKRYFSPSEEASSPEEFEGLWDEVFRLIRPLCPKIDRVIITKDNNWRWGELWPKIASKLLPPNGQLDTLHHHVAHTLLAIYDSPFKNPLVVSYDGGGSDGAFFLYHVSSPEPPPSSPLSPRPPVVRGYNLKLIEKSPINMGVTYSMIGLLLPDVEGKKIAPKERVIWERSTCPAIPYWSSIPLAIAGKLMGFSALGEANEEWVEILAESFFSRELLLTACFNRKERTCTAFDLLGPLVDQLGVKVDEGGYIANQQDSFDLAASLQMAFQLIVENFVKNALEKIEGEDIDGVVMTGGGGLNVLTNTLLSQLQLPLHKSEEGGESENCQGGEDAENEEEKNLLVYAPSAPNDCGLGMGLIWSITPPPPRLLPSTPSTSASLSLLEGLDSELTYAGFPLWDGFSLEEIASHLGAKVVDVEYVAKMLSEGKAVGVIHGRQEVGPRALGHRSLLCYPNTMEAKDKMNRLKEREWYRPVAPVLPLSYKDVYFEPTPPSPYMSFAPKVKEFVKEILPAIVHYDSTSRLQTVTESQEEWLHALLLAVGNQTGHPVLINTSFNTKGQPLVNTITRSLQMMRDYPDLDAVIIENYLFLKE